jgi:intracellular septation protein
MYMSTGKIAKMPLIGAIFVGLFGGLTLYLQDETFIKVKVTVVNLIFAVLLLGGQYFGRSFLKDLMGEALQLPPHAWRSLTIRWGVLFLVLAGLNEYVWRNYSSDTWVTFKVFGMMGITVAFAIANTPFMMRHLIDPEKNPSANG